MEAFFAKYAKEGGEKMGLKMIHKKLHKVIENYDEGSSQSEKDVIELYVMLRDFAECAEIHLPQ